MARCFKPCSNFVKTKPLAEEAIKLAGSKLPIRTKFAARRDVE